MAGREVYGVQNSAGVNVSEANFIVTPTDKNTEENIETVKQLGHEIGFARISALSPEAHDEMIAFTSQLCHLISSAYVRDRLAKDHRGYSAGSFRDMVRVGAPDPDLWTELFLANRDALTPVLDRYIARLADFRDALADNDAARLHAALEDGVAAKQNIDTEP
jgi:prephenate dehydrogenase